MFLAKDAMVTEAIPQLEPVFAPVIENAGFRLVRLRLMGGTSRILQVMAERPDGSMDVEGCSQLSHALLDFIELHDPIAGDYEIEVSSPGIDRPLTRLVDFARWSGHEAKIELHAPVIMPASVGESQSDQKRVERKRFRAVLLGTDGQDVIIRAGKADIRFPFRSIANAKLVMTDKLINEALKGRDSAQQPGED